MNESLNLLFAEKNFVTFDMKIFGAAFNFLFQNSRRSLCKERSQVLTQIDKRKLLAMITRCTFNRLQTKQD